MNRIVEGSRDTQPERSIHERLSSRTLFLIFLDLKTCANSRRIIVQVNEEKRKEREERKERPERKEKKRRK